MTKKKYIGSKSSIIGVNSSKNPKSQYSITIVQYKDNVEKKKIIILADKLPVKFLPVKKIILTSYFILNNKIYEHEIVFLFIFGQINLKKKVRLIKNNTKLTRRCLISLLGLCLPHTNKRVYHHIYNKNVF